MTKNSEAQFNSLASNYASSSVHRAGASLPVMLEFAAPQSNDVMLDIATGTGNTALTFAPLMAQVTGVDLAVKMLEAAHTRALEEGVTNATFLEGSAENLPFADANFDLVTSRHAPHHFRDAAKFLREVARVLKPSGRFVMADQVTLEAANRDWVDEYQRSRDPSHFTQRTVQEWQELARGAGLRPVRESIVPYRLEFVWWTEMAGCSYAQISRLLELLENAPDEIQLERSADGSPLAHTEPMLVVRLEKRSA